MITVENERGKLEGRLRDADLRVTSARLEVLALIQRETKPMTIKQLARKLTTKQDTATLYRTLSALTKAGMAKAVVVQPGVTAYENASLPHHHHLICQRCGQVEDILECNVPEDVSKIASDNKFAVVAGHNLNYLGLCKPCAGL